MTDEGKAKVGKLGTLAGVVGLVICLAGVVARFLPLGTIANFQAVNLYITGVGLMVLACWLKLEAR